MPETDQAPMNGKVAFVTGAAQGLGRGLCVAFAEAGADVIAGDLGSEDLGATVAAVEATGRKIVAGAADVRDQAALDALVARGVAELGGLDAVVANAGISNWARFWEMTEDQWQSMIDINLSGVWRTFRSAAPILIEQGRGGSLTAISSVAGLRALPGQAHYSAAKHGVVGLVRAAAIEMGPYQVRVNSVHPWGVQTRLTEDATLVTALEANPTYAAAFRAILPEPIIAEPADIAAAVVWLASPAARCVTGIQMPVDMGSTTI
jgi:NAD(P)-dependent dehydrogenase (short-subunit alcohol dehydrogenase family)